MTTTDRFPEYACPYARRLAEASPRFARQVYDRKSKVTSGKTEKYLEDPFGELSENTACPGLRQRFPDRALIMTTNTCFMNCRHCTRRGILGKTEIVDTPKKLKRCVEYIKHHPKIRDILLSGGDILTLNNKKVSEFVNAFASLPQIDIVRVCTRAICTNPSRITPSLAKILSRSKKVWVNTQFNCADEVTLEAIHAASILIDRGIPVSCQTVLLKGVNDSTKEMLKLFRKLSAARIRPYYVFMCDQVAGIDHFRIPLEKAQQIEKECAAQIGGLSMPRFVADLPGAPFKTPISACRQQ